MEVEDKFNRIYIDLIFILASGEPIKQYFRYEDQIEYYINDILHNNKCFNDFINYGKRYRLSSRLMYPNLPQNIRNDMYIVKYYASFVVFKELYMCRDYKVATDIEKIKEKVKSIAASLPKEFSGKFIKDATFQVQRYVSLLNEEIYRNFLAILDKHKNIFNKTISSIYKNITTRISSTSSYSTVSILNLLQIYGIQNVERVKFHIKLDTIIESTLFLNCKENYIFDIKNEFEKNFPSLSYKNDIENYINNHKNLYIIANKVSLKKVRDIKLLYAIIADMTIKLAFVDGVANLSIFYEKVERLIKSFSDMTKIYIQDKIKECLRFYSITDETLIYTNLKDTLFPYKSNLLYIRELVTEEIIKREEEFRIINTTNEKAKTIQNNTNEKQDQNFSFLLAQKDEEIEYLKQELEYYENLNRQDVRSGSQEYERAITNLFIKLCDIKFNSPLNELYLIANEKKESSFDDLKSIIHNLIFIFKSLNISPYQTGNIGKKIKFQDTEIDEEFSVDEKKLKEGINCGVLIYPGWKYKNSVLVLPRVSILEEKIEEKK